MRFWPSNGFSPTGDLIGYLFDIITHLTPDLPFEAVISTTLLCNWISALHEGTTRWSGTLILLEMWLPSFTTSNIAQFIIFSDNDNSANFHEKGHPCWLRDHKLRTMARFGVIPFTLAFIIVHFVILEVEYGRSVITTKYYNLWVFKASNVVWGGLKQSWLTL